MNPRVFIFAAVAGLACGLLVRLVIRQDRESSVIGRAASFSLDGSGKSAPSGAASVTGNWEARIARYLNTPTSSASPPTGPAASAREDTDGLLHLLTQPVSAASIREGVAQLNSSDPAQYAEIMASVFERWARESPEEALAAAPDLRNPDSKAALVWKVFYPAAGDPGILIKAMAQPPGMIRSIALAAIAEASPPDQLPDLLRQSTRDQSPGYSVEHESFQSLILRRLFKTDPELPLKLAQETEDPVWRTALLKTALAQFPGNAPKVRAGNPNDAEALTEVTSILLRLNPAEGIQLLDSMPQESRREVMRYSLGHSIWSLVDERFKEVVDRKSFELLRKNIEQREGPDGFRAILADSALNHGAQGLSNTAKWLATNSDFTGLDDLTRRATQSEPFTTARWLATMPPSPERDRAVSVFAETHAATDPESATTWAESIADPGKREATLTAVRKIAPK